jgi:hypothetical protein
VAFCGGAVSGGPGIACRVSRANPWSGYRVIMALFMMYHQVRRCFGLGLLPTFDLPQNSGVDLGTVRRAFRAAGLRRKP